jgi:hypothetical protein
MTKLELAKIILKNNDKGNNKLWGDLCLDINCLKDKCLYVGTRKIGNMNYGTCLMGTNVEKKIQFAKKQINVENWKK